MSWLFGFIGSTVPFGKRKELNSIHPTPISQFDKDGIYLAAGGIKETCLHGVFSDVYGEATSGWVVVGLGIKRHEQYCAFLSAADWVSILSSSQPKLNDLDGHFVALKYQRNRIECFTDQLGLRTLYLAQVKNGVAFSTRLDWISMLRDGGEIDFKVFGSQWLLFSQMSYDSAVKGIQRLGPGGVAACTSTSLQIRNKSWSPDFSERSDESFISILRSLMNPNIGQADTISLGLSGGLDSRVLLSLLLSQNNKSMHLHVFGHPDHPDVCISKLIAQRKNLRHIHYREPFPEADVCVPMLREYLAQTYVVNPASTIIRSLRYYPEISSKVKLLIDGEFGEVARRQYLNRILLSRKGKSTLLSGTARLIAPYLSIHRAGMFNLDTLAIMQTGVVHQIEQYWKEAPSVKDIGEENFLDLMAIRTRFPNYRSFEQARMDAYLLNYMPFAQPSLLRSVFRTPLKLRRNGRLFRQIIRRNCISLGSYPLVKTRTTYPFIFSTVPSYVWTKIKNKLGIKFTDPDVHDFLYTISEFVQDTANSSEVKSYPAYDYSAIQKTVNEFYSGKKELAYEVDWWLSFEVWRQTVNQTRSM